VILQGWRFDMSRGGTWIYLFYQVRVEVRERRGGEFALERKSWGRAASICLTDVGGVEKAECRRLGLFRDSARRGWGCFDCA
jgi:hypothetical protein